MGKVKVPFNKPWLSCAEQVTLLQSRGLIVTDVAQAQAFLSHVNYYRFSGYCLAFEDRRHVFRKGTTFEHVLESYQFDQHLRDLATDALEVIELDLRSTIAQRFGQIHGPFGHTKPGQFFNQNSHAAWTQKLHEEAQRSNEPFVTHFRDTYLEFPNLPIWMAAEIMSFGALSYMYKSMHKADQKAICARYGRQPRDMASWMHHLVYIRNLCAHHARLWDRVWSIKPDLPAGNFWAAPYLPGNNRLFATLLIMRAILIKSPAMTDFATNWHQKVQTLLTNPPKTPAAASLMGLPKDWQLHPIWK